MADRKINSKVESYPFAGGQLTGDIYELVGDDPSTPGASITVDSNRCYSGVASGYSWRKFRKVSGLSFKMGRADRTTRYDTRKGIRVPLGGTRGQIDPVVEFTLGEIYHPFDLQAGFGQGETPVAQPKTFESETFGMTLHGLKHYNLPIEFHVQSSMANFVTTVAGSADTGGSMESGSYFYFVAPVVAGEELAYLAAAESEAIAVSASGKVTLTWVNPTGVQPDSYKIYRSTTEGTYTTPAYLGYVDGDVLTYVDTATSADTGAAVLSTPERIVVTDIAGTTVYTEDTDYDVDWTEMTIKRISGGGIGDGEDVSVTIYWAREAGVVIPIGAGNFSEFHRPLMFIGHNSGSADGTSTRGAAGMVRLIVDAADWSAGADSWDPQNEGDDAGIKITLPADYNEYTGRIGEVAEYDERLGGWDVRELGG